MTDSLADGPMEIEIKCPMRSEVYRADQKGVHTILCATRPRGHQRTWCTFPSSARRDRAPEWAVKLQTMPLSRSQFADHH